MTREEKEIALYCLKANSDYHSEVCEECVKYPNCDHTIQDDVTESIIKALEQEPKWIPVSEKLPSDNKEVLVYLNACPYLAWFEDGEWRTEDFVIDKDFEPIAWMPLPTLYKAESAEDEECPIRFEVVVNGNCAVCGKPLTDDRFMICKECEGK